MTVSRRTFARVAAAAGTAAIASPAVAVKLLAEMQEHTGGLVSAFEIMPRIGLELVTAHIPGARDPNDNWDLASSWQATDVFRRHRGVVDDDACRLTAGLSRMRCNIVELTSS